MFAPRGPIGAAIVPLRRASGLALLGLVVAASCGRPGDPHTSSTPPFVEAGDLEAIRESGVLRVLIPRLADYLPRGENPVDEERALIADFARQQGLEAFWIPVDSRSDLIRFLLEGRGDVVASNLTATAERRKDVAFTVPVRLVREQVVTRKGDGTIARPADLVGRYVAVRRSSSFWGTLTELRERYDGIMIQEVPEDLDTDEILYRVATRRLDVTVADSNHVSATLAYRDDLRVACDLTEELPVAWAVRPSSKKLLRQLNRFLSEEQLSRRRDVIRKGDLREIRASRVLRVLTRNSAATYFLWRGKLMGFEYELAGEFAKRQHLRVEMIVPRPGEDLLTMLVEGKGDLVAAALTPSDGLGQEGVTFTQPYDFVSPVVVAPATETGLHGPQDLAHRTLYVRPSSAHWRMLEQLRDTGVPLVLQGAPEHLEAEEIIGLVAQNIYPLTVADSHVLDIELTWRDDVVGAFPLGGPVPLTWAVRSKNPALLQAANAFLEHEYRGAMYNVLYRKYFQDPKKIRRHVEYRRPGAALSPYDVLVRRYADKHDFDWRLIVAQMYEESGFDPNSRSFAGAIGLLQVMPQTAAAADEISLRDPETNIREGVGYLSWLRNRFDQNLSVQDRMWFMLAAYNVGLSHVEDARRLAAEQGLDPDRWFDNVERAMLLLSRPEYARRSQHGWCRGSEPVAYVRDIRSTYEGYVDTFAQNPTGAGLASANGKP